MGRNLYNANISRTTLALSKINSDNPVGYSYRYDQLNRLTAMRQHGLSNMYQGPPTDIYDNTVTSNTEFYPRGDGPNGQGGFLRGTGVTKSQGVLPFMERNDEDFTSLAKLTTPLLTDYLEAKDPKAYGGLRLHSVGLKVADNIQTAAGLLLLMEGASYGKGGTVDSKAAGRLSHYAGKGDDYMMDCSDLASDIFRNTSGGNILEITPKSGKWMNGIEYGERVEVQYYQVFENRGCIYDPMYGDKPIKTADYLGEYYKLNPGGLDVKIIR
ncbi:hypothetical protein [Chitinophaga silvisoli]|uniref:RHS repeat-associated core domain-containing protein n=1 Tax=Chitinophaga silvisoli TaxID=2291814 RepID=A0A3E1NZ43_9BACT|nr:hypothetical protein [Chitinophaga silvisoli]RFM33180.1 hypothetical protein DXN04_19305 [Chitinophaga silvisoli]